MAENMHYPPNDDSDDELQQEHDGRRRADRRRRFVTGSAVSVLCRTKPRTIQGETLVVATKTEMRLTAEKLSDLPSVMRRLARRSKHQPVHLEDDKDSRTETQLEVCSKSVFVPVPPRSFSIPRYDESSASDADKELMQTCGNETGTPTRGLYEHVFKCFRVQKWGALAQEYMHLVLDATDKRDARQRRAILNTLQLFIDPCHEPFDFTRPDRVILRGLCVPEPLLDTTGQVPRIWFSNRRNVREAQVYRRTRKCISDGGQE